MQIKLSQFQIVAIVGLSILMLISITFYLSIQDWRADYRLAKHEITKKTITHETETSSTQLIATILDNHLFGEAIDKIGEVPLTNLQLKITGISKALKDLDSNHSKVYISMGGQLSKIYKTGDLMAEGVKVHTILDDAVILENDGRLEKLPLPREKLEFKARKKERS